MNDIFIQIIELVDGRPDWQEEVRVALSNILDDLKRKSDETEELEDTIQIPLKMLLDSGHFGDYCDEYGMNPWAINEGLADRDTKVSIKLSDFKKWL